MAIYPYICPECNYKIEIIKSIKEIEREEICPSCGSKMDRKIGESGFELRGLGWSRDGHCMDIDDAEEVWYKKDPSKVQRGCRPMDKKEASKAKGKWKKRKNKKWTGI